MGKMDIGALPMDEKIREILFDSRAEGLSVTAERMGVSKEELLRVLTEELKESGMKVGGCALALDFAIAGTNRAEGEDKVRAVRKAVKDYILHSMVFWANVGNRPEYV